MTSNTSDTEREGHEPLILIIDNSDAMRDALSRWIPVALAPCRIKLAQCAETGLRIARSDSPAVVLMDLHLPDMNGIDATRLIRDASPETKVIIFTLSDASTYRDEAFEAGACAYTLKHRAKQEILPLLRKLLGKNTTGTPHHAVLPIAQNLNKETLTSNT